MFRQNAAEPFRHALLEWRKLGLGPIVDRVAGNGVLTPLDSGEHRLTVWRDGDDMPIPAGPLTEVVIDDELTICWSGLQPGPTDLDNGNPLRLQCVPITLADGNVWQVPVLRDMTDHYIPTDVIRSRKTGELLTPIKLEYVALYEETEYFFELKWKQLDGWKATVPTSRAVAFCTQVLGLRYRFCDATNAALRILDSTNVQQIIEATLSWDVVMEIVRRLIADESEKKNQLSHGNANGSSGPEDSGPIIAQVAANNGPPP